MRVLGIDLGLKRIGLALSDALGISVRPLVNMTPKNLQKDCQAILDLCHKEQIQAIVIGYPTLSQSKEEGEIARRARLLAGKLRELQSVIPVKTDIQSSVIPAGPDGGQDDSIVRNANNRNTSGFRQNNTSRQNDNSIKIYLVDEYLSSKQATSRLVTSQVKKSKRRKLLDSEAARILVENFLAENK